MKTFRVLLAIGVVLAVLALGGCVPNVPEMVKALADSDRSWCIAATGYGVNLKASGTGLDDGDVSCTDGGHVMKSRATSIGVPIQVVPQIQVGQPTYAPGWEPVKPRAK